MKAAFTLKYTDSNSILWDEPYDLSTIEDDSGFWPSLND